MDVARSAAHQYRRVDPLKTRIETNRLYSERHVDLEGEVARLMNLRGDEAILDVGCGPGHHLLHLRRKGHRGPLTGLDQSAGMIAEASRAPGGESITWVQGDAMALPFAAGTFDWVTARHMLYHVPDIAAALAECGRVAPRLLAVTNAGASLPRIFALRARLLEAFGLPEEELVVRRFCIENAEAQLSACWGSVETVLLTNAFVFHEPEPIAAYILSTMPAEAETRLADMARWLTDEVARELARLGGEWRDPKDVALYACSHPCSAS